jgi:nucleotide-binding universal stress UspA family protein
MDDAPILICYDDSNGARHAIDGAAALLPDRRVVVVDVAPPLSVDEGYDLLGAAMSSVSRLTRDQALSVAEAGAAVARAAGLAAEARADVAMSTWEGIVEVADDIGATAIVIGSRGLKGLRQFFGGSVARDVATHAGRPVMIVPPSRTS